MPYTQPQTSSKSLMFPFVRLCSFCFKLQGTKAYVMKVRILFFFFKSESFGHGSLYGSMILGSKSTFDMTLLSAAFFPNPHSGPFRIASLLGPANTATLMLDRFQVLCASLGNRFSAQPNIFPTLIFSTIIIHNT